VRRHRAESKKGKKGEKSEKGKITRQAGREVRRERDKSSEK
jgi:hypothetical protein